jgi:hypothetical protein
MNDFLFLIIPILVLWSWLARIGFTNRRVEGAIIVTMPIPFLSRVKRHGIPIAVTAVATLALALPGMASPWWFVLVGASAIGLLRMPQAYTVTTRGIRAGHGNFHRWTEFAGVHRSPAGATLQTIRRGPGMPIWLSGSREDDEFVHLLRTLIRDSYQGKTTILPTDTAEVPGLSQMVPYPQEP